MKTKFTALALITVTALTLAPKPAQASDKGLAIVGGFLGGLIVATAINDSRHDGYEHRNTTVIVERRDDRRGDRCDDRRPDGCWETVTVKVWVPATWIEECGRHGRVYQRYIGAHFEYRTDRVWVSNDRQERRGFDRDDDCGREVSYGYGHRR